MDRATFWSLLDKPPSNPTRPSMPPEALQAILEPLPSEEIQSFAKHFHDILVQLNRWDIWAAGSVILEDMSGDSFHYFRSWLIGKGEAAVQQALTDPDGLGPYIDDPEVDNELLEYVTIELLEARGLDDPREAFETSPDDEPAGEPFEEETIKADFPKLAAQFA